MYVRILHPIQSNQIAPARVLRVSDFGLVLQLSDGSISRYWPAEKVERVTK